KDVRAGQFRIYNPTNDGVLFSRTIQELETGYVSDAIETFNDQWFTFEVETLELINIEFDLKNTVTECVRFVSIYSQEATNRTSEPPTPLIKILETTEQQYTFDSEVGLELGISIKFSSESLSSQRLRWRSVRRSIQTCCGALRTVMLRPGKPLFP
ncbi:hypothetical protein COCSADRAFT_352762, partial [Bipolaris sorokiniana ND90Pr]